MQKTTFKYLKLNARRIKVSFLVIFLSACPVEAQHAYWSKGEKVFNSVSRSEDMVYEFNLTAFRNSIEKSVNTKKAVVAIPDSKGKFRDFEVTASSVLHPDLATRYPEIASYAGKSIDGSSASIRFSITLFGLRLQMFVPGEGTTFIESLPNGTYKAYDPGALIIQDSFICDAQSPTTDKTRTPPSMSSDSFHRNYRMAIACTTEYAAFHINAAGLNDGTLEQKKAAVLSAMVISLTNINAVFERELSVSFTLVPQNESLIFITNDSFDNNLPNAQLLPTNQGIIDNIVGSTNYDIGHLFTTGLYSGTAAVGTVCETGVKAQAISRLPAPQGYVFDIRIAAHEIGHQFDARHTHNNPCNREDNTAFEPGSGTTIMSYSGICPPDILFGADSYFHSNSLARMQDYIAVLGNCAALLKQGNTPPVVDAGADYTIPFGTPFLLQGSAVDADNDLLTYCWEQMDNGISIQPPVPSNSVGPTFRSMLPSVIPNRYFPQYSDVLANNLAPTWEVIPARARVMHFDLTVRDNSSNGGHTDTDSMIVNVANTGPFAITSQNSIISWLQNTTQSITWNVAGTTSNGINTSHVTIRLSTDGGQTFSYVLAENTPNDGQENIIVPNVITQNARIKIEAVGNIYYALNTTPFFIGYTLTTDCQTYTSQAPFNLPNNGGFSIQPIQVAQSGPISDINLSVEITHPNINELRIQLVRPGSGIQFNVYDQDCSGANMNVTFDSQAMPFSCINPLTGTMSLQEGTLNVFNANTATGNWTLLLRDLIPGSATLGGTVNRYQLEICTETFVLAPLSIDEHARYEFALYPNPSTGQFAIRYSGNLSGLPIGISVYDSVGRSIKNFAFNDSSLNDEIINLSGLQSGVYFVSLRQGTTVLSKKLMLD